MDKQQRTIVILLTTLAVVIGISAVLSELFDTSKELASIATWTPERRTAAPRTVIPDTPEPTFTPSPTVDDLEKANLVKRVRDAEDRRKVIVSLTKTGQELIGEIFPRHLKAIVKEMNVLTAEEQETLGTLCRKLGKGA